MTIKPARYSNMAMVLHWALAIALAFQIGLGWRLDDVQGSEKFAAYQFHKSIGITILVLSLARLAIRYWKPRPAAAKDGAWAKMLSKFTHCGLYAFMIGVPLSGWAIVSTSRVQVPTMIWGMIPLPHLPLGRGAHEPAEFVHEWLTYAAIGLFFLHIIGALRHHFALKDGLLSRMMPLRNNASPSRAMFASILALTVMGAGFVFGRALLPIGSSAVASTATPQNPAVDKAAPDTVTLPTKQPQVAEKLSEAEAAELLAKEEAAAALAKKTAEDTAVAAPAAKKAVPWQIAPGGQLGFVASWSGTPINGRFNSWNADVVFSPDDLKNSRISVTVDLISADTNDGERDTSLKGAEFFNTAVSPQARYTSTRITDLGGGKYRADGTLSLRGKSQPVALAFTLKFSGDDVDVSGSTNLNRTKFGVGQGQWAATDQIAAGVSVNFNFKARKN